MNVSCFVVLQREYRKNCAKMKTVAVVFVVQGMQKLLVCDAFSCVDVIAQAPYSGSVLARFSSL